MSPDPSLLATTIHLQVGHGHQRRRVSKCLVWMLQKYIRDVAYVAMTMYACCMRMFSSVSGVLRLLFQVFHLDVAKVDLDVAYVAMTKYA